MDSDTGAKQRNLLAQWALRTIGQSVIVGAIAAAICAFIAAAVDSPLMFALTPLVGALGVGAVLAGADAPRT